MDISKDSKIQIVLNGIRWYYLVEAADDICYQIMDLEDAFKLGILSYEQTKDLYLDFYDTETDKKQLRSIETTLTRVTDKNEQISYLRAGVIGKLIRECILIFQENKLYFKRDI